MEKTCSVRSQQGSSGIRSLKLLSVSFAFTFKENSRTALNSLSLAEHLFLSVRKSRLPVKLQHTFNSSSQLSFTIIYQTPRMIMHIFSALTKNLPIFRFFLRKFSMTQSLRKQNLKLSTKKTAGDNSGNHKLSYC